jgi:hypothetical protein
MDPFLEKRGIFHELHTQMLSEAQRLLQPQVRPKYIARLERHLSEGGVWALDLTSLNRKEPDVTLTQRLDEGKVTPRSATFSSPSSVCLEELDDDELEMRKQRRIVIYVNEHPRIAVTTIELLSPSNKIRGSINQERYLEKRSSALHGGLHWVEIDLLRGGERPEIPPPGGPSTYCAYIAKATPTGWEHQRYAWALRSRLPRLPVPLLDGDCAILDLQDCFAIAYDSIAADDEADYPNAPPPPPLSSDDAEWVDELLRSHQLR